MSEKTDALIQVARGFIGTKEEGSNHGKTVEEFQKSVDDRAQGESWCLAFVQFCVKVVAMRDAANSPLFPTEHCMTLWNKTNRSRRSDKPAPGWVVLWQKYNGDTPTQQGHAGIVTEVLPDGSFKSVEGNTGPSKGGVQREGDGVYEKTHTNNQTTGPMRVKGFIRIWDD